MLTASASCTFIRYTCALMSMFEKFKIIALCCYYTHKLVRLLLHLWFYVTRSRAKPIAGLHTICTRPGVTVFQVNRIWEFFIGDSLFMRVYHQTPNTRYLLHGIVQVNLLISVCRWVSKIHRLLVGQWQIDGESSDCCYSSVYLTLKSEMEIHLGTPSQYVYVVFLFILHHGLK